MENLNVKNAGSNYLAKIIKLNNLTKHPNADRLQICNLLGVSVITGLDAKEGGIYVYCPIETSLNSNFLSFSNSFSNPELNADKTKKGFFESTRVKPCRLRSARSEGYIFPVSELEKWAASIGVNYKYSDNDLDKDFDSIGDILFCQKYVNKQKLIEENKAAKENKKGKKAKVSKVVDGQFAFHRDTSHLGREIYNIQPNDLISWTFKYHGSSGIVSKVLCKKKLKWYEKIFKFLGLNIVDTHYDYLFASRTVIKNAYETENQSHFYDSNIWKFSYEKFKPFLKDGLTLYFEIVGFTPTGSHIQKKYDYGCEAGKQDEYIYRITYTSPSGDVYEFSWPQIKDFCVQNNLKHVEEAYYGYAKDMFPELSIEEHWHENFLQKLNEKYLEKKCHICKNDVWAEGYVLRKESGGFKPYKHKSFNFKLAESKELDSGEANIEDIN